MRWITRQFAKVDRIACPWLIKKFVDPEAEFVFLPLDTDSPSHDASGASVTMSPRLF
ncbi:MAG TPA: chromate resistance protein ChrB domain-containing protein [Candidatus Binatia bacterium]